MQINNVRFIVAAITTLSAFSVYVSRVNLSITIIAMVDDSHHQSSGNRSELPLDQYHNSLLTNQTGSGRSDSFDRAPAYNLSSSKMLLSPFKGPLIKQEKFNWSQMDQGNILGSFFYGYILFQIPGARMAESMGAKWIIMAASIGSAFISLVFPLSTQLNSIYLLMMLRFVMGLCQSAFFPAAYVLFCRWLPEAERAVLLPIMFIGSNMGNISTYILSSYLIGSAYGWPSVFYLSGMVCLFCGILWCVFGSNGPEDNWLISEKERLFIEHEKNNQSSERNSLDGDLSGSAFEVAGNKQHQQPDGVLKHQATPRPDWSKLLRSVPVWTLIWSMYGNEWSNVVICYELPSYLTMALNFPIEQNGVINSFFQLSYTLASPLMSSLGAQMLERHLFGMRKIHVRKLFQSLATFGQMACFLAVPICGANRALIITFMFSAIIFKACANAGDIMVSSDLSPEYAGTIFAFANSVGNTAGVFVPSMTGLFVADPHRRECWTLFWLTTAAIMGVSGLIFLIFGETSRQDFSRDPNGDRPNRKLDMKESLEIHDLESSLRRVEAKATLDHQKPIHYRQC